MMTSMEEGYFSTEKATGFIKYYEGEEYAFVAILPNDAKANANDFMNSFTYAEYKKFIASRSNEKVRSLMPEFKSDYGSELNKQLVNKGVTDAFNPDKADFTGIAKSEKGNIYISKVIHKTHIEVDRAGTRAAAVTAIEMTEACEYEPIDPEYRYVICDRPFVYAIVDAATLNPVFIGTVNAV